MNRLTSIAPDFARQTEHLSDAKLRLCAQNACRASASAVEPTALQARVLAEFPREFASCSGLAEDLRVEAARYDDIYFDKYEKDTSTGGEEFSRARRGTALADLLSASRKDLYDCIYEACMVVDDPAPVLRAALQ